MSQSTLAERPVKGVRAIFVHSFIIPASLFNSVRNPAYKLNRMNLPISVSVCL